MGRVVASATPTARLLFTMRSNPASRILDTTQIGRLIAFSSATDVTIQPFNSATRYSSLLGQCLRLVSCVTGVLPHLRLRAFHRQSSLPSLCYRTASNSVAAL